MKEINLVGINEKIYYKKLENGLDIYLYYKENSANNYVTLTTKFGSCINEFVPNGKNKPIKLPNGVAHFLEHKVFAQKEDPQPEEFFSKSGAISNAYTTFKNTTYLFSGPNNIIDNVLYLLDFVQSPYFTKENVESEKGIIKQEIHMCDDNLSDVLYEHIRKNVFYNNTFKESIIGTIKDINKITPELLNTCYTTFYNPENMFLVVTGNFDKDELIREIENKEHEKKYKKISKIKIEEHIEKDKVVKEREIIKKETKISKYSYNIKIPLLDNISKRKFNLYLYIIFSLLFDDTSEFDEELKKEGIITSSLYINILNCDTHILISLINETNMYEKLEEKIEAKLKNIKILEEDLERKKKVLISNEIFSCENIEVVNDMIVDNIIFDNHIEENMINIIKSINIEELNKIIKNINLSNKSVVVIKGNSSN